MITCNCQSPDKITSGGATDGQILTWSEVDQEWVPTTITLTHIAQSGATDGQVPTWRDGSGWIAETPTNIPLIPPHGDDIPQFTYTEDDEWGFKSTGASINRNAGKAELRVLDSVGGSTTLGSLKFSGDITLPDDITAGAGVTDHGALTGLADDDHTQYHTDARGDARYSLLGHEHDAAQIISGVLAAARLPTGTLKTDAAISSTLQAIKDKDGNASALQIATGSVLATTDITVNGLVVGRGGGGGITNTALGHYALRANTTGYRNTALGYYAGVYLGSGSFNETSTESIYLGYNTKASVGGTTRENICREVSRFW